METGATDLIFPKQDIYHEADIGLPQSAPSRNRHMFAAYGKSPSAGVTNNRIIVVYMFDDNYHALLIAGTAVLQPPQCMGSAMLVSVFK